MVKGFKTPVSDNSTLPLERMSCTYYLLCFKKDQRKIQALIDSSSEVNAMTPVYAKKLGFRTWKTDVGVQKIYNSSLTNYGMVIAGFQVKNKERKACFFQEICLLANTSDDIILGMSFLIFSNADIIFTDW